MYLQRGEGNLEVQNPKEYLRYKYKYILNNNLYHALSMSESTVDRHVYMFLNRMVYTTYNHTDPEAIKVEYTHAHAHTHIHLHKATLIIRNTQTLKLYFDPLPPFFKEPLK